MDSPRQSPLPENACHHCGSDPDSPDESNNAPLPCEWCGTTFEKGWNGLHECRPIDLMARIDDLEAERDAILNNEMPPGASCYERNCGTVNPCYHIIEAEHDLGMHCMARPAATLTAWRRYVKGLQRNA